MKTILVTGGAGFIGSALVHMLVDTKRYRVVNLDLLTYAGSLKHIEALLAHPAHIFVKGDVRDKGLLEKLFAQYHIGQVIHCAAESHVERGFDDPALFFSVNVMGTQCLLDAAKKSWGEKGGACPHETRFLYVSTDEVYGDLQEGDAPFLENAPFAPNHPYAASKAAADLMVMSYYKTYGFPALITRGVNTYGKNQHQEKLLPSFIRAVLQKEPLLIHGSGLQKRDFIHVEDHCRALLAVLEQGRIGEAYHIGANEEHSVLELAMLLQNKACSASPVRYVEDRLFQDKRLALNWEKIRRELNFLPVHCFEEAILDILRDVQSKRDNR